MSSSEIGEGKKLVLFDVDHTLIVGNRAHWNAFSQAFKKVYDITLPKDFPPWHGYTDLQIIYSLMDMFNIARDEKKASEIIRIMVEVFLKEDLSGSKILVGVEDILSALKSHKNIIIGLVTGNIEAIAYAKLKHFRIDEYFVLGGFGDTSEIRSDLVKEAIKKAEKFGKVNKRNVFVIGDTTGDIAAAHGAGVKVISVCTGDQSEELLREKNPDYIFPSLEDYDKIIGVIKNG